jgi:hypothetical protein
MLWRTVTRTNKVYYSLIQDPTQWESSNDVLTFFYVPKRWWSVKAWRLALSLRGYYQQQLVKLLNHLPPKKQAPVRLPKNWGVVR